MDIEEEKRLIFGHSFNFQNEPMLKEAYTSLVHQLPFYSKNQVIQVRKTLEYPMEETFPLKTDWVKMSGQNVRYFTEVPAEKLDRTSSWAMQVKDVVTLIWDAHISEIIYSQGKYYTPERLRFWIFHTFFPLILDLQGKYHILHVGAVEVSGRPILFSAFSYGGKSTITDYFLKQGHPLLSDDSLGIEKRDNAYYTIPSYPFYRPYRQLETLGYSIENFSTEPKPLYAVYLLEKSEADAEVEIAEVKGIEKFKAFHYSTFIDSSFMKQERFSFFTEMAKHVPVYNITVPWSLDRLGEVYKKIMELNIR